MSSAPPTLDIDTAMDLVGFGPFQIIAIALIGCMFMTEIMTVQLLSIIGPQLQCVWRLTSAEQASLTSAFFFGMLAGDLLIAPLSDRLGRRDLIGWSGIMVVLYALLSSLAPTLLWLLALIFCSGFWIGGMVPILVSFCIELMPTKWRGTGWYVVIAMCGAGNSMELLLAWPIMYKLANDWRWLIALTPLVYAVTALIAQLWLPQSPRQSVLMGRNDEAVKGIEQIAKYNKKPVPGVMILNNKTIEINDNNNDNNNNNNNNGENGNLTLLFHPRYLLKQTTLLTGQMIIAGFGYFCLLQLIVRIPLQQAHHKCQYAIANYHNNNKTIGLINEDCSGCDEINFAMQIPASLADPAGCLIMALIVEQLAPNRMLTLAALFILTAIMTPLISLCVPSGVQMCLFLIARALTSAMYSSSQLFTIEFLPTSLRATGAAVAYGSVRATIIISPFFSQVLIEKASIIGTCCVLAALYVLAAIFTIALQHNTKDEPIAQTVAQSIGENNDENRSPMLGGDKSNSNNNNDNDNSSNVGYGSLTKSQ